MAAICFASSVNRARRAAAFAFCSGVGWCRRMVSAPRVGMAPGHPAAVRALATVARAGTGAATSGEHLARVDGLEHGAEVVPVGLREPHVALDGLAVQAFGFGDLLGALGE